ncbi:MAG TPA: sialidase family protein [Verrucomicrobiae bacterium]|nr:sialidase family protein [Verrucomicrobiae bacterium]
MAACAIWALACIGNSSAQTWTELPFLGDDIVCSGDGSLFFGAEGDGAHNLFKSTDAGETWNQIYHNSPKLVVCSGDGMKIAAYDAEVFVSTNSGATFSDAQVIANSCAWSADGRVLATVGFGIYISTNNGMTLAKVGPPTYSSWNAVALSGDGRMVIAGPGSPIGPLYCSTNRGATWSATPTPTNQWRGITCGADGQKIAAITTQNYGVIYISTDGGVTWTGSEVGESQITGLASSADGSLLTAAIDVFYISRDFGASWTSSDPGRFMIEPTIGCSQDGNVLVAAMSGHFEVAHLAPPLKIAAEANQLTLSWPWPSSRYALQQSPDLSSMIWGGVTNNIVVTNYRNQVILSRSAAQAFYRLQGPNP